uniref:Uncharacterized protein n=1 Tax=Amphimedon queenslandica TaxID=400682 RepID=A0A1X7VK20_AMPQE
MKSYNSLTKSKRHEFEKKSGVRYSCLLELPYFNAPHMCIIDPMHNLLLGTSKLMSKVNSFVCLSEIGKIPSTISASFAGFTAEQWKNWTIYFSPFALKSSLPWNHYNCWMLFVKACWLLCRHSITITKLFEGDKTLLEFCKMFVDIYGSNHCP